MKYQSSLILATTLLLSLSVAAQTIGAGAQSQSATNQSAANQTPVYQAKTPKLNKSQIDALLAKPADLLLIDLRRPDELTKIGGFAVYLSIQAKDLAQSLAYIPKDRKIVTVSNHAGRAGRGADLLAAQGYQVVGAIGVQDYEAAGGTLVKLAPPQPKTAAAEHPAHGASAAGSADKH